MITPAQHQTLAFLQSYIRENGYAPSYDEIADGLGLHSKSGILTKLRALEAAGYIRRLPNKTRAIEVIRLPENLMENKYGRKR